jgi:hypothetical protein
MEALDSEPIFIGAPVAFRTIAVLFAEVLIGSQLYTQAASSTPVGAAEQAEDELQRPSDELPRCAVDLRFTSDELFIARNKIHSEQERGVNRSNAAANR